MKILGVFKLYSKVGDASDWPESEPLLHPPLPSHRSLQRGEPQAGRCCAHAGTAGYREDIELGGREGKDLGVGTGKKLHGVRLRRWSPSPGAPSPGCRLRLAWRNQTLHVVPCRRRVCGTHFCLSTTTSSVLLPDNDQGLHFLVSF